MMEKKSNLGKELAEGNRPMFMSANEIVEHIALNDSSDRTVNYGEEKSTNLKSRDKTVLRTKLNESKRNAISGVHGAGLYKSIKDKGFEGRFNIVDYGHEGRIFEGHHRLAAQKNLNPQQFNAINWVEGLNY